MKVKAKSYLDNIDTYVGGKRKLANAQSVVKLSSNENPYGPSPRAIEAYRASADSLHRYPEDGALSLREALAAKHGFAADQIICGTGSDDVIRMLCHAYSGPGDEVVYSAHGFAMYRIYASQFGATTIAAPETNLRTDIDALLDSVTDKTKLMFIANPNNPTGSYIPKDAIHALRNRLRGDVILVLDGAYAEYMAQNDYSDGRELVESGNTVIMRTFSKAYGLSTLRVGWGYGPKDIINTLYKVRAPFNITQPSLEAAIAALNDSDYLAQHVTENNAERARLETAISNLGLVIHPSYANFMLIEFSSDAGRSAHDANVFLQSKGLIVREVTNYHLPQCLRVSIGTKQENDAFLSAMQEWAT